MTAAAWGIDEGYHDVSGTWHQAPEQTIRAFLAAMHARDRVDDGPPPPSRPTWVVRPGAAEPLLNQCDLTLEDGTVLPHLDHLPPDLPLGYHCLRPVADGPVTQLLVSPGRCHLPDGLRIWGWAVQLYAARSGGSWGIGDLADLRAIADWTNQRGGRVLVINPLHAATPVAPTEPSPYFPSSRVFRNPLYLRVEEVDGAASLGDRLDGLARQGRALNQQRLIDRDEVLRLKLDALDHLWASAGCDDERFERFRAERGGALRAFATYCVLAERHGPDWHDWPGELRHPESPAIRGAHREHADRIRFHEWLQWLLDEQLARAGTVGIVQDLAIGFDDGGADAWMWQDWVASGVTVGAPPDEFNTLGQDWGLPPFVPWKLRGWGYGPYIETIRAVLRHAGGLRVDHVMGLFRL
ncbi:MAG: 4-alpha-glucanotransferase, partial [Actinomycetota bacterium]